MGAGHEGEDHVPQFLRGTWHLECRLGPRESDQQ